MNTLLLLSYVLEQLVLINDLDAMFIRFLGDIVPGTREMRIHDGGSGRMSGGAGTTLPVDL